MIQLVIEGKNQKTNMSVYDIPLFLLTWAQISFSGDLTNEIQRRINLASSAFGRLSKRVFGKKISRFTQRLLSMMQ